MGIASKVSECRYLRKGIKGDDGLSPRPNLLEGTSFYKNLSAWDVILLRDIYHLDGETKAVDIETHKVRAAGMFGTDELSYSYKNSIIGQSYEDVLVQELASRGRNSLIQYRWYTLSFWAKGTSLQTYLYGGFIDTRAGCIADGVKQSISSDGAFQWPLYADKDKGKTWNRHTLTFKTKAITSPSKIIFRLRERNDVSISAIKIEDGTEATDWCHNEFDMMSKSPNENLLNGTDFVKNRDAWNLFEGIVVEKEGIDGHNLISVGSPFVGGYHDVLQQTINGDVNVVRKGRWNTLSFWMKGRGSFSTFLYPSSNDRPEITEYKGIIDLDEHVYADGVERVSTSDGRINWYADGEWKLHTLTFKAMNRDYKNFLLFRIKQSSDIVISSIKLEEGFDATAWSMSVEDKVGKDGLRGQIPYPMGEYIDGTDVNYICTVQTAPYVIYKPDKTKDGVRYIMNKIGEWNSKDKSKNPKTDYAENGVNATWIPFRNYKFLESEIALIHLGLIGKSVFWDNYAFSQDGLNSLGETTSAYQNFNPDKLGMLDCPFTPNFMIDWAKGILRANNAYIEGSVSAKEGKLGQFTIDEYGLRNTDEDKMAKIHYSCDGGKRDIYISGFEQNHPDIPFPLCTIKTNKGEALAISAITPGIAIYSTGAASLIAGEKDNEIKIEGSSFGYRLAETDKNIYANDDFVELRGEGPFYLPTEGVTTGKRLFIKNINNFKVTLIGKIMRSNDIRVDDKIFLGNESMMFIKDGGPEQWVAFYCG